MVPKSRFSLSGSKGWTWSMLFVGYTQKLTLTRTGAFVPGYDSADVEADGLHRRRYAQIGNLHRHPALNFVCVCVCVCVRACVRVSTRCRCGV